ncbi:MAG: MBL fold metallo-hydrolase [Clostridia bacterium]|nr:MBL fold metallo-hydrolase [Clostridia bacterium]
MHIVNLASGSKANSTFVDSGKTKILIDAGLTEKTLKERLCKIGEDISAIQAVLVTHEHIDHIRALKNLAKNYKVKICVHKKLENIKEIVDAEIDAKNLILFEDEKFVIGDIEILPVGVSHDATYPVSFILNRAGSVSKVGFITDTGYVSKAVQEKFAGVKMVFIESNYDEEMLLNGKYPYIVKQRIFGEKGHLSNAQSLEFAKALYKSGTRCFILSHISENNNTKELAYKNYVEYFESKNLVLDKDVFIRISYQGKCGNNFNLREE